MQQPQTTPNGGYLQENMLETEGNVKACSNSCGEADTRDGVTHLIYEVMDRNNLNLAYKRVKANKGSPGVDGMTVDELMGYIINNRDEFSRQIADGSYEPQPVKREEVPKDDGSKRKLGIPTVKDRFVQQAILQVIEKEIDPTFSDNSFGFRPKRSAHDAIKRAKEYYDEGYRIVVDIDLEKYFDTVNHDRLMHYLEEYIPDKIILRLIRKFLRSGVSIDGVVFPTEIGTPQGGNLSPLLSNIYLNKFDKELERRGHKFVRYADDCNIYVRTRKAGYRVMESVTKFLEDELETKVNREKSAVGTPTKRKFLGFCLHTVNQETGFRPHLKSKRSFEKKLKQITKRNRGHNIRRIIQEINEVTTGWINFFGIGFMKGYIKRINQWLKRRIRVIIWKRWKSIRTRYNSLIKLGIPESKSWEWANTRKGNWRIANSYILHRTITNKILERVGYKDLTKLFEKAHLSY